VDDLKQHRRIGYVEDLLYTASLNYTDEIMRNWDASFEVSSAVGQTEAVRSGAGIGILHNYIARQDASLKRLLPDISIHRTYWTTWHESARDLLRVKTVIDWLQNQVRQERAMFH
jgi:DNA-binding transcriptional LysR family regulator